LDIGLLLSWALYPTRPPVPLRVPGIIPAFPVFVGQAPARSSPGGGPPREHLISTGAQLFDHGLCRPSGVLSRLARIRASAKALS